LDTSQKYIRKPRIRLLTVVVMAALFVAGYLAGRTGTPDPHEEPDAATSGATQWTCSMHPQIIKDEKGLCDLCGMDLIPLAADTGDDDSQPRRFTTSESARALMQVQTAPVERRFAEVEVRLPGMVRPDETRLASITAWVPGRIERMYADYTGMSVQKGDHLVDLYSPDLLAAKDELRRTQRALESLPASAPEVLRDTARATLEAVRSKLLRWGLTEQQLNATGESGALSDRITIYAPIGGTVTERNGREGMYVETGERIYAITDLSAVWVELDAYEADLPWIHFGQPVSFTAEALPGNTFEGRVAFISPTLDERTRTAMVRVNVPNPGGLLKPGMLVRGVVRARTATGGRVMDPGMAGKWISPMHPEIVKDGPGSCDVCGMPLVRAESLGYVSAEATDADMPLVIPATAPLITGRRAVVYVEVPGTERPAYVGREITLGPRAGDFYIVASGLREGERVVTNGNFKIDSALELRARPSMMSAREGTETDAEEVDPAFQAALRGVVESYLSVQVALAGDTLPDAGQAASLLPAEIEKLDPTLLSGQSARAWETRFAGVFRVPVEGISGAADIEAARAAFEELSIKLIEAVNHFGTGEGQVYHRAHCPMAFDFRGADWIQSDAEVLNPYFGASMLRCGTVEEPLGPDMSPEVIAAQSAGGHDHG
jgi:membrane fusion protein, copper/silver efflux system